TYSIIYYSEDENYNDDIQSLLNEFDNSVNTYRDDSYLSRFNASEQESEGDPMLLELIEISKTFNKKTDGYFDPSVEPLSEVWGFSKEGLKNQPTKNQIDSVMQFVGMDHVKIEGNTLIKNDPRFKLSFNSITGYINDKIATFFNERNVRNYMIEIGGEVYAHGQKSDESLWTIGIDEPTTDGKREVKTIVQLKNEALATSGNYRKYHIDESTGEKIVHTINPTTGYAKASEILSATVIAPTTGEADAIATALMAMGYEKATDFINKNEDLKFYLIWVNKQNEIQHKGFNGFEYEYLE
ncbi:MAG: FAD:protein FMN transferase, partial [Weeksellaceae bacterium]